jgi:hypothetical protein
MVRAMAVAPYCRPSGGGAASLELGVGCRAAGSPAGMRGEAAEHGPRLDEEAVEALLHKGLEGGEAGVAQQAVEVLVQDHLLADARRGVVELWRVGRGAQRGAEAQAAASGRQPTFLSPPRNARGRGGAQNPASRSPPPPPRWPPGAGAPRGRPPPAPSPRPSWRPAGARRRAAAAPPPNNSHRGRLGGGSPCCGTGRA